MAKARFTLLVGLAVLAALAGFAFIRNLIDFPVYYAAGQSLLGGRTDLYAPDFALGRVMDYRYPPFFLLAFFPLWLLPYKVAAYLWYLSNVLEISLCVFFIRSIAPIPKAQRKMWVVVFFLVASYFVIALHYGNAHLLAVALMFAAFYFAFRNKPLLAGLLLALSISIKLTPAFAVPYFALKREWRLLAWTAVLLIVINLTPALYFGFEKNNSLLKEWFGHVVVSQEFHEANGPINLSLKGELRRSFTEVDYAQRVDGDVRYPAINILSLPSSQVDTAWITASALLCLAMFGLIAFVEQEMGNNRSGEVFSLEVALLICAMLFVGPLTSKIYFIALLWPVAALAAYAFSRTTRQAMRVRRLLIVLALINSVLPLLPGRSLQRWLLVLGVDFYVNLLLLLAVAYALWSMARPAPTQFDEPQRSSRSTARTS
ncbi:MAG: glycosyltransferase family 87 protein [Blastocatellia bacterium]